MGEPTPSHERTEHEAEAESRVLAAAEGWAQAMELVAQAADSGQDRVSAENALQQARIVLYDAVLTWRASRRPADFTGRTKPKSRRRSNVVKLLATPEEGQSAQATSENSAE